MSAVATQPEVRTKVTLEVWLSEAQIEAAKQAVTRSRVTADWQDWLSAIAQVAIEQRFPRSASDRRFTKP